MSNYYLYPNNLRIYQNNGQFYLPQMNNISNSNIINNINYLNANIANNINYIYNQGIQTRNLGNANIYNLNNTNIYTNNNNFNQQIQNNLIINNNNIKNNLIKNNQSRNSIPNAQNNNNNVKNNLAVNAIKTQKPNISNNNNNFQNKNNLSKKFEIKEPSISPPSLTREEIEKILFQLSKYICKICGANRKYGTGFFCKIPYQKKLLPVLITNNHVLKQDDIINNKIIKITIDDDKIVKYLKMDQSRIRLTNEDMDFTLIEIKPNDEINYFFYVVEDLNENNYKNKIIYILQHPKGEESSHSIGAISDIFGNKIIHFCSTDFGSSGSPILSLENSKVIGVHRRKGELDGKIIFNEGTFIKYIIDELNKPINNIGNKNIIK